jgi:hypothetical protein
MTYRDLIESRSKSTIHTLKLWLRVGNIHAKFEDPSFNFTQVIIHMYNENINILASLLPEILCIIQNKANDP